MMDNDLKYVGFWKRFLAFLLDVFLILLITLPFLFLEYGSDFVQTSAEDTSNSSFDILMNYILPAFVTILLWKYFQATPGKMVFKATIVDKMTGGKPSLGQLIIRYLGYFVSLGPVGFGYIWIAFDKKKQGFHDKLANTVVVQPKVIETEPETEK
tara:strand:+ start:60 stop:524 length:465 start_codon:yes stop_codon:yes gene_type:complete